MKFSAALVAYMAACLVSAMPVEEQRSVDPSGKREIIIKRASMTDTCSVGYCTQNGGTKGGSGGSTTTVTTLSALKSAVSASGSKIIYISGTISGAAMVDVGSDKTIIGAYGSLLSGIGLRVKGQSNVILRNVRIAKVLADYGDALTLQDSTNVWVDHCDFSSDMNNGKDYYDGLLDITHGSDYISVTNTFFHDHYKASLIGHSDSNGSEDTGHLRVTYANNYWYNINSRGPSIRFGTGHIFNSYYLACNAAINTRMGAQVLVQSTQFDSCGDTVIESSDSDSDGYAVAIDVNLGGSSNTAPTGSLTASSFPYSYSLTGSSKVKAAVYGTAGQTLTF